MESLSSESKGIALDILEDILSAIERLEDRTKDVQTIDDFLCSSSGYPLLMLYSLHKPAGIVAAGDIR